MADAASRIMNVFLNNDASPNRGIFLAKNFIILKGNIGFCRLFSWRVQAAQDIVLIQAAPRLIYRQADNNIETISVCVTGSVVAILVHRRLPT